MKITYEFHGDTIIQNRVDLKGTSDDGWDNSITVKSVWSTIILSDLNCRDKLTLTQGKTTFTFCFDDVIQKLSADIGAGDFADSVQLSEIKTTFLKYRRKEIDTLSFYTDYITFRLLRSIDFSVENIHTKEKASKVRLEQYETGFSGGRTYYFIGDKGDTLARFTLTDWMR